MKEYVGRLLFWARGPKWVGKLGCLILCVGWDVRSFFPRRSPRPSVSLSPCSPPLLSLLCRGLVGSWPSSSWRLLGERRSPSRLRLALRRRRAYTRYAQPSHPFLSLPFPSCFTKLSRPHRPTPNPNVSYWPIVLYSDLTQLNGYVMYYTHLA